MPSQGDINREETRRGLDPHGKYNPATPVEILKYDKDYKNKSWMQYSVEELGKWVHLLVKRAEHRTNSVKKQKDIHDARNYWRMMGAYIDAAEVE